MNLSHIFIYPVKALGPCSVEQGQLLPSGLQHDRRWMLVDARTLRFVSQRQMPELALLGTRLIEEEIEVFTPEQESIRFPLVPDKATSDLEAVIWESTVKVLARWPEADEWFSDHLHRRVKLVHFPYEGSRAVTSGSGQEGDEVNLADSFPYLLVSSRSVKATAEYLGQSITALRFRPNFLVDAPIPFEEEGWQALRIGQEAFRNARPCPRCQVINIDPSTGKRRGTVLKKLGAWRGTDKGIPFGIHLVWESGVGKSTATVRVGDPIIPHT